MRCTVRSGLRTAHPQYEGERKQRFVAGVWQCVVDESAGVPLHNRRMVTSQPRRTPSPPQQALTEHDIEELQALLDAVPAPLEPLDASMVDGYLCGVLVQPQRIAEERWMRHIVDAEQGRPAPRGFDAARLQVLVRRRHAELDVAIERREWFDPWVFELEDSAAADEEASPPAPDAVYPWVAGFATALGHFPALMQGDARALIEPLALLYRHLQPDDLEDADELLEEIESLEPPADLAEAVEELVRATLLLADVARPLPSTARRPAQRKRPPARARR
jgi:uncharacterized protein